MSREIIVEIRNNHIDSCGKPPHLDPNGCDYIGYFENEHDEQWTFVKVGDECFLRGGETGWNKAYKLKKSEDGHPIPPVTMNDTERLWLNACWFAANGWG